MKNRLLIRSWMKRHRSTMIGIFLLMMLVSMSMVSVLTSWLHANQYVVDELNRMKYGDIAIWSEDVRQSSELQEEIAALPEVASITSTSILYSDYEIQEMASDQEGQLLVYHPDKTPYRLLNDRKNENLSSGEMYVSPSILAMYQIELGDSIQFAIARNGGKQTFTIVGTFEDPIMGSSMIGMKTFLISQQDYDEISKTIETSNLNALARFGQVYHITQVKDSTSSIAEFNRLLNENTSLGDHTLFAYSKEAITEFMMILQHVFTGLFLSFAFLLLMVSIFLVGYSITSSLKQDEAQFGILKSLGFETRQLRNLLLQQYLSILALGIGAGMICSIPCVLVLRNVMIMFSGVMIPTSPRFDLWLVILFGILLLFYGFLYAKTRSLKHIVPLRMIQQTKERSNALLEHRPSIKKHGLLTRISLRQLMSGKKRYISVLMSALLLVFFTSTIMRMNAWLGADGKGMMDAFNPADLDLGVQVLGEHDQEDVNAIVQTYSNVESMYALAMPSVSIEDVDVSANVITQPERFHIQEGRTSEHENEIVLTQTLANDYSIAIGDEVTLSYNGRQAKYQVVGIYQCANEMGSNLGMSKEAFLRIGEDTAKMWCTHYFFDQPQNKQLIMDELQNTFGGDVYIHENSWPGLFSILSAMKALLMVMFVLNAACIAIVSMLTGNKVFFFEKRHLAIYKSLGFTSFQLQTTFVIRYAVMSLIGSLLGSGLSIAFSDRLVSSCMRLYGISNYTSQLDVISLLFPILFVTGLFAGFAYLTSKTIKKVEVRELMIE